MSNRLGLRIGTNAIGWTFYSEKNAQLKMGVSVYPIPIEHFGTGKREQSYRAKRRHARMMRKRFARFRRRKVHLLKRLIEAKMCPLEPSAVQAWQQHKKFPEKSLRQWLALCPYTLRKKALNDMISLHELGRILYHMSQRRGFFVGRRMDQLPQKYLFQGSPDHQRLGILATEKHLRNNFLGAYLHSLLPQPNKSYTHQKERIRNRYLSRQMYVNEIHAIWKRQERFHSVLTEQLRDLLIGKPPSSGNYSGGIVFYQRPFSTTKKRLTKCPYEQNKYRTVFSHPLYEELRGWQWVNSLICKGEPLSLEKKKSFLEYFLSHSRFSFWEALQAVDPGEKGYNRHYKKVIQGGTFHALMQNPRNFGMHWKKLTLPAKIDIWHCFYFFNSQDKLAEKAQKDWGFPKAAARRISRIFVDKRTAPLSLKAIRNLLDFLREGYSYPEAVFLAGLRKALGEQWPQTAERQTQLPLHELLNLVQQNDHKKLILLLKQIGRENDWNFQLSDIYGLQIPAKKQKKQQLTAALPSDKQIENLNNPLQIAAAYQIRKIMRQLIIQFGAVDQIKITFDTDIKVNRMQRCMYLMEQKRKAKLHQRLSQILINNNIPSHAENIERLELWGECSHTCPYSGTPISFDELFTTAVQVILIHPWQKSLNKSMTNKVLCKEEFTDIFRYQSPREFYANEPQAWNEVKERTFKIFSEKADYPFAPIKARKFLKRFPKKNYLDYQWHESGLLSNTYQQLLEGVCADVQVHAIHGVQYLLEHWSEAFLKDRIEIPLATDFRLKALQAAATLYLNRNYLDFLATHPDYTAEELPESTAQLPQLLRKAYLSLLVTHVQKRQIFFSRHKKILLDGKEVSNRHRGIRGSIHKETRYGRAKAPFVAEAFHVRKSLREFTNFRQLNKIADPNIKALLHYHAQKENPLSDHVISRGTFFEKNAVGYDVPKVYLSNKKGDPVPIRKVRIREVFSSAVQLNPSVNAYVNPRKNHHILIYKNAQGEFRESAVSFWEALQRLRTQQALYQIPEVNGRFVCSLHINDLFLLGLENPAEAIHHLSQQELIPYVYRVQKLSRKFYEFRQTFDASLYAYDYPNYIRINNFGDRKTGWFSYEPYKIKVNSLGEIIVPKKRKK